MLDFTQLSQSVFHVFNRSNDRGTLFHEDQNYQVFLSKLVRQLPSAAYLLAYCIMPNHFHLLLIPKHPIRQDFPLDGERYDFMPTEALSAAMQRLLMGYSKSYNTFYKLSGSRFQQHSKAKYHQGRIQNGLDYIHQNPVEARLVDTASEWGYSSYNEYAGLIAPPDCICDIELGRRLLGGG